MRVHPELLSQLVWTGITDGSLPIFLHCKASVLRYVTERLLGLPYAAVGDNTHIKAGPDTQREGCI